jgi:hypothetical protein
MELTPWCWTAGTCPGHAAAGLAFSEQCKAESFTNLQVSGQQESVLGIEPEQIVEVGTK